MKKKLRILTLALIFLVTNFLSACSLSEILGGSTEADDSVSYAEYQKLWDANQELRKQRLSYAQENAELKKQKEDLQSTLDGIAAGTQYEKLLQDKEDLTAEKEQLEQEKAQVEAEYNKSQSDLTQLQSNYEELETEKNSLDSSYDQLEDANEALRQEIEQYKQENEALKNQIAEEDYWKNLVDSENGGYLDDVLDAQSRLLYSFTIVSGSYARLDSYKKADDSSFTRLVLPKTYKGYPIKKINHEVFKDCTYLISITIPDTVTTIGNSAFAGSGLTSIVIPDSVTSVGNSAFEGCANLASVKLSNAMSYINSQTFKGCESLTELDLRNVTNVGMSAFAGAGFEYITLQPGIKYGSSVYSECKKLKTVSLTTATSITTEMFSECDNLVSVVIESGNNNDTPINNFAIEECAFMGCSRLTSVTGLDKLTTEVCAFGNYAFKNCALLKEFHMPQYIAQNEFGTGLFENCYALETVYFAKNSTYNVASKMFKECTNLTKIENFTPKNVGIEAFYDCQALSSIHSVNAEVIDDYAFYNCKNLISIIIPDENSVVIGDGAFQGCSALKEFKAKGLTIIGDEAFDLCSSLENVDFPNLTYIGEQAFRCCNKIEYFVIPETVTYVGGLAFLDWKSSQHVYIDMVNIPTAWDSTWRMGNNALVHRLPYWCYKDGVPFDCDR